MSSTISPDQPLVTSIGLLDTSVFVAVESGRPVVVDDLPLGSVVSIVTIGELEAGVLASRDVVTRSRRLRTLHLATDMQIVDIDREVASRWAAIRVSLRDAGRRLPVNDAWIAACALARGLPVVTQDDDYDVLRDLVGLAVVRV